MELTTLELKAIHKHLREKKAKQNQYDELSHLLDIVSVAIEINEYKERKLFNQMKGSRK